MAHAACDYDLQQPRLHVVVKARRACTTACLQANPTSTGLSCPGYGSCGWGATACWASCHRLPSCPRPSGCWISRPSGRVVGLTSCAQVRRSESAKAVWAGAAMLVVPAHAGTSICALQLSLRSFPGPKQVAPNRAARCCRVQGAVPQAGGRCHTSTRSSCQTCKVCQLHLIQHAPTQARSQMVSVPCAASQNDKRPVGGVKVSSAYH